MSLITRVAVRWPAEKLIRLACYVGIPALLMMAWSVASPTALPVVLGMSVGQGLGILAFAAFLFAVIGDAVRSSATPERATRQTTEPTSKEPPEDPGAESEPSRPERSIEDGV